MSPATIALYTHSSSELIIGKSDATKDRSDIRAVDGIGEAFKPLDRVYVTHLQVPSSTNETYTVQAKLLPSMALGIPQATVNSWLAVSQSLSWSKRACTVARGAKRTTAGLSARLET